jgi:hypothetical protein
MEQGILWNREFLFMYQGISFPDIRLKFSSLPQKLAAYEFRQGYLAIRDGSVSGFKLRP